MKMLKVNVKIKPFRTLVVTRERDGKLLRYINSQEEYRSFMKEHFGAEEDVPSVRKILDSIGYYELLSIEMRSTLIILQTLDYYLAKQEDLI